jgi:hypothetical protein
MEEEISNSIIEDIHKYKLDGVDSKIIRQRKYKVLKDITADKRELTHFYKLLNNYRYIDEVDEIRIGSYLRFFNLLKTDIENGKTLELMRGGFICDMKTSKNGDDIVILCRNGKYFFNIKMNECIIFQKNTKQEQILIEILDHLNQ